VTKPVLRWEPTREWFNPDGRPWASVEFRPKTQFHNDLFVEHWAWTAQDATGHERLGQAPTRAEAHAAAEAAMRGEDAG
jgi:hypothetical protein